ncbi:fluoride efflux transporter FluC [Pseudactinotalea suaedae]|uniref:fluoride efflux transporter FluC n=1 Tax=Pseudactinotalea suaedae TaxID=1524924 RepID=UPI0012E19422|nr:CrcB family protein [Pseudactinotalea suaedae]
MIILVALAGGLGAAARFLVDGAVQRRRRGGTPLGTLVVNTTACLLIGLLTGWASGRVDSALVTVIGVGLLGGYSTFSTASVEAARLLLGGRIGAALAHAFGMLVLGLGAGWAGIAVGHALAGA